MKSWKTPTPEEVSKAVAYLSRVANYTHFFDTLVNPSWIKPLWDKGFFKNPPEVEYEDSGRVIRFPPWPESRYLARMAPHAPHDVAEMLAGILDTENIAVREDILRAALAMPVEVAVRFVGAATMWLTEKVPGDFLAMKSGQLMSLLAAGGQTDAALSLARALLKVQPEDRPKRAVEQPLPFDFPPEPVARFGRWHYEQILEKYVPQLVDASGFHAIILLCDLLEEAVSIQQRRRDRERRADYSSIWRPAIEDHKQNHGDTILDALVSSLRDGVERLCHRDPKTIPELVELLEKREWLVFQRISLYILSRFAHEVPLLVERCITNEELFDNDYVLHEYYHLCRVGFADMSPQAKEKVLGWIRRGLAKEELTEWIRSGAREPTDQLIDKIIDGWRLDRLAPIREHLTGEWKEYYTTLVNKIGEPRHPDFPSWHETKTGPNSPLTPLQISAMPMTHILKFMRAWKPSTESLVEPSVEGLGRALAAVVTLHPKGFSALALEFIGLEPTYVRALLSGLEHAAGAERQFDWNQVLRLCEWVIQQPISTTGSSERYPEKDPDWRWTRGQIADLFSEGFRSGRNRIPFEHRSKVWRILEPLTDDPYPDIEADFTSRGALREAALDSSWNTTRGKAMRAVIRYGVWVRENVDRACSQGGRQDRGLAMMPEVKAVLEAHLDTNLDPSIATRSVYGQWLPWLLWLDQEWLSSKLDLIFPSDEGQASLRQVVWGSYITLCKFGRPVFEMLRSEYRRAIESLGQDADMDVRADPGHALAEHLMTMYWSGGERLESENSLVMAFFEKAPQKLREHALHWIGSFLNNHPLELSHDVADRLTGLWQWRRDIVQQCADPDNFKGEVARFGLWFVSGKLDQDWAFRELIFAIQFSGETIANYPVVERLANLAAQFPFAVAQCFEALLDKVTDRWRPYYWREHAFEALQAVIESGNSEAAEKAKKVANRFGELGFRNFKALVRP